MIAFWIIIGWVAFRILARLVRPQPVERQARSVIVRAARPSVTTNIIQHVVIERCLVVRR